MDDFSVKAFGGWGRYGIPIGKRFASYTTNGMWWFRVYGYGLRFKDTRIHQLLFSERYKFGKGVKIGKWHVAFLYPTHD